jgi:hypothetical protein
MRKKLLLVTLIAAGTLTGLFSPAPAKASGGTGGSCVTYCSTPNACGYVCCFQQCCNGRCIDLDCAPPPPCGDN